MSFNEVLNKITSEGEFIVSEVETSKNGILKKGISIREAGSNVGPTFYPEDYVMSDEELEGFIRDAIENVPDAGEVQQLYENFDSLTFGVKAQAKDTYIQPGTVYKEVLDVILIPVVYVGKVGEYIGSTKVTEPLLSAWGKTIDEVFEKVDLSYTCMTMREVLMDMMGTIPGLTEEEFPEDDVPPMFVLSNEMRRDAGSLFFFEEVQKGIYEKIGGGYVVLPSSVHESIVLPIDTGDNINALRTMVSEVNDTQVSPEDRLTYSVYVYDGTELKIA